MTIDDQLRLSRNLRALRKMSGITQEALAHKIGLGRTAYSQLEQGTRQMDLQTLTALSEYYRIPMDSLISCSIQEILSRFFMRKKDDREERHLLDIYAHLSESSKGQLLERGDELRRLDLMKKQKKRIIKD